MPAKKKSKRRSSRSKKQQEEEVDIDKAINMAVTSGQVQFGTNKTINNLKLGKGVMVLMVPEQFSPQNRRLKQLGKTSNVPILEYPKSAWELGAACGRPHRISALTIHDPGDSRIDRLIQ